MADRIYPRVVPNPSAALGYDGTDFRAILVDSTGKPQADIVDLPGKNTLNNFYIGYWAQYEECGSDLNAAGGHIVKSGTAVPSGEIWVIQNVWSLNNTTSVRMQHRLNIGDNVHYINDFAAPGVGIAKVTTGTWVLKAGDYVTWLWVSTVIDDDLYWGVSGYKCKIV